MPALSRKRISVHAYRFKPSGLYSKKRNQGLTKRALANGVPVMRRFAEGIGHDYDVIRGAP
jgi:hypothetical protein